MATTTLIGRAPPVSEAIGLLVQAEQRLPQLKLWIGIADIPPAAPATLIAGAAIHHSGGTHRSRWVERRRAVLGGPLVDHAVTELVQVMRTRLAEDLAAWAAALESAAARNR